MAKVFGILAHEGQGPTSHNTNKAMPVDDLVMQRARSSANMVLAHFSGIITRNANDITKFVVKI